MIKSTDNKKYSYSLLSRNRGLALMVAFIFLLILSGEVIGFQIYDSVDNFVRLGLFFVVLTVLHILWDRKIKKNLMDVTLNKDGIVIHDTASGDAYLRKGSVIRVEEFPAPDNLYDNDFMGNIMSSGIRVFTNDGIHLIFTKIRGYREIRKELDKLL